MLRFARLTLLISAVLLIGSLRAAEPAELAALRAKAEKGNGLAMYNLGLAYAQGEEVAPDPPEAFVWLSLAAEYGATGKALDSVLGNITDAQLVEGRKRLAQYRSMLAVRAAAAAQSAVRRPANREFSVSTPTLTNAPTVINPGPTSPTSKSSRTAGATEPSFRGQLPQAAVPVGDELIRVRAELARANSRIEEQAATIARLQDEVRGLLPVATVATPPAQRTSPPDGSGPNPPKR